MPGYGTNEGFTTYATAAGYTVPAGDIGAARQRGSAYIDGAYGARFTGIPTGGIDQERAWPRTGASAFGSALASDIVPLRVVNASYEAAYIELKQPGSLSVVTDPAKRVKRQKVDTIEREFFEPGGGSVFAPDTPVSSVIEGILAPLIGPPFDLPAIAVV
ncbi:DnaT-like ssDNA-binding protein [Hoeflea sp. 108]|uniref:DnaT-like ssDNA-binding protein n=1 Tax=Hoeflea sp. 108 TaxID=1116369 RepID=UPI0003629316|nr:DnaT-like ssDNA-binding protein [Hoeflea sp. 108]